MTDHRRGKGNATDNPSLSALRHLAGPSTVKSFRETLSVGFLILVVGFSTSLHRPPGTEPSRPVGESPPRTKRGKATRLAIQAAAAGLLYGVGWLITGSPEWALQLWPSR